MTRIGLLLTMMLFLNGCLATLGDVREITTNPSGATITVEDAGECVSPCAVKLTKPSLMTVAKAGYKAQYYRVQPGGAPVHFDLELAAPTEDVDTETLPDLK